MRAIIYRATNTTKVKIPLTYSISYVPPTHQRAIIAAIDVRPPLSLPAALWQTELCCCSRSPPPNIDPLSGRTHILTHTCKTAPRGDQTQRGGLKEEGEEGVSRPGLLARSLARKNQGGRQCFSWTRFRSVDAVTVTSLLFVPPGWMGPAERKVSYVEVHMIQNRSRL